MCQRVEIAIQEAFRSMSNQSNYAHEKFWGDIKGSLKNKKIIKTLILLIMVGNMASIFTQIN